MSWVYSILTVAIILLAYTLSLMAVNKVIDCVTDILDTLKYRLTYDTFISCLITVCCFMFFVCVYFIHKLGLYINFGG